MFWKKLNQRGSRVGIALLLAAGLIISVLAYALPAQAHCDSANGPVAAAAHQALETGNVDLILPYVKPDAEAELTAAFNQASTVMKSGGDAQALAERYFVETAVRLHRAGEGAPYTGLTDAETPHAIVVADRAMQSGSMSELNKMLEQAMKNGVKEKYHAVEVAREEAAHLNTVEAHRERVEAELGFELYVYELYLAASGEAGHGEAEH